MKFSQSLKYFGLLPFGICGMTESESNTEEDGRDDAERYKKLLFLKLVSLII